MAAAWTLLRGAPADRMRRALRPATAPAQRRARKAAAAAPAIVTAVVEPAPAVYEVCAVVELPRPLEPTSRGVVKAVRRPCPCGRKDCRPTRPRCRLSRLKSATYQQCLCSAYHYPHRYGSGRCVGHPDHVRRQFEQFTGQRWDGEPGDTLGGSWDAAPAALDVSFP
jgi:hypothetical protein